VQRLEIAVGLWSASVDQRVARAEPLHGRPESRLGNSPPLSESTRSSRQPAAERSLATRRASLEVCSPVGWPDGQRRSSETLAEVPSRQDATVTRSGRRPPASCAAVLQHLCPRVGLRAPDQSDLLQRVEAEAGSSLAGLISMAIWPSWSRVRSSTCPSCGCPRVAASRKPSSPRRVTLTGPFQGPAMRISSSSPSCRRPGSP
jgi:hypothetical protein